MKFSPILILTLAAVVFSDLGEFGGDYQEYMKLLKGNSVFDEFGGGGTSDISGGQARQEEVMGGGEMWTGGSASIGADINPMKKPLRGLGLGLGQLKPAKKVDRPVSIHFDVNVLVSEGGKTKVDPIIKADGKDIFKGGKYVDGSISPASLRPLVTRQNGNSGASSGSSWPAKGGDAGANSFGTGGSSGGFDWKKFQEDALATQKGGNTAGWGSKTGGGGGQAGGQAGSQAGGQAGPPPMPAGQPAPGPASFQQGGQGKTYRAAPKKEYLPKQMVVILHPELELFDSVSQKIDEAIAKRNKTALHAIMAQLDSVASTTEDMRPDDFAKREVEGEDEAASREAALKEVGENLLKDFIDTREDPWTTSSGLAASYRNVTFSGLSTLNVCSVASRSFVYCTDSLEVTITLNSGPNMPFRGKVIASFTQPTIKIRLSPNDKMVGLNFACDHVDYQPAYDSAVPINPWSQVSLGGYLMGKVKKVTVPMIESTLMKAFKEVAAE